MLYQIMFSNNLTPQQAVTIFLVSIFVFFVSLAFHEYAHGFAAYKMGDLTPKLAGRLTLNPLKHLDMTGMLFFMFLGVGWAKPMPVNPLNFKKYKKGTRLVAIGWCFSKLPTWLSCCNYICNYGKMRGNWWICKFYIFSFNILYNRK